MEVGAEQLCDEVSAGESVDGRRLMEEQAEHLHVFERRDEDVA